MDAKTSRKEDKIIIKSIESELRKEFTMIETFELKPNFAYLGRKYELDPRTVKKSKPYIHTIDLCKPYTKLGFVHREYQT